MPYKAFVYLEKEVHKVTISFLRLKKLKEKMIKIINTTNNKTRNTASHFKIVDNNGQDITSNKQLRIAFKEKPVFFFYSFYSKFCFYFHSIQYQLINKIDNDDDEKKCLKEEKKDEVYNIVKYKSLDIELDKDHSWNKANKKAHEMVNEMINNKQQGIIVIATNIEQLAKPNYQLSQKNIPFSMMINSSQYMKKKLIIGSYSVSSFHSKKVIFDNIIIDGCVYAIDCIIDGFGNCHITQQLIYTNKSVIRCQFYSHVFTCPWPIDIENVMELGESLLEISKCNEAIQLFRFVLCFRLQTLHDSHIDIANSYSWLGGAYADKGRYDKAIEYYEKDFKIRCAYREKGEYDKAIEYNEKSLKIRLNKLGSDDPDVATSYNNLGLVYYNKGKYDKAIEYNEKSLKIILNKLGSDHLDVANLYNNLGHIYKEKREYDQSFEYYEKSLTIYLNKWEYVIWDLFMIRKENTYKSIECFKNALKASEGIFGNLDVRVEKCCQNLGFAFKKAGEKKMAKKYFEESWRICSAIFGEWSGRTLERKIKIKNLGE
ncbi:hypothetical protein RFI_31270 [Reticulomyxa filosa]|uniref:Uncharacterized protein n=1 Tax=Reticulomyxa filosa TaxID=46433 RepID=X6LXM6_RETFI|nr:hypothetical protein RFI_31270 [Reticulomyxa filosa]|eukprot:ETO06126.1 hypothetical protein RFI_31270 [Reticulomyxa filosa]